MIKHRTMRCTLLSACLLVSSGASPAIQQVFKDNGELAITLSQNNFNRLVVRGDKIIKAHFPEGSMAADNDEDGSLYVSVASHVPFTLFLSTESGHHFSTTVTTDESLGKTVEFIASHATPPKQAASTADEIPKAGQITALMTSMMSGHLPKGYEQKKHYGQVRRLNQGLMLTPKATLNGMELTGEVYALYNGGSLPLDLHESWFSDNGVKAISLSATTLAPKQSTTLYRVLEVRHG